MEQDGVILTFDTRDILSKVDAEQLTQEDLELVIKNFKRQEMFVKLIRVPLGGDEYACLYSI